MMREAQFHEAIVDRALPPPHRRFGVYRNNVASALINALRVRYPVTAELLGTGDFARLAGDFALSHLPQSPVLITYGEAFADSLEPPLRDVARLENLWWQAYHAAEAMPVPPEFLARFGPEELAALRFRFHPSFGLMRSGGNAGTVWQAVKQGEAPPFADEPQFILVARPEAEVKVMLLQERSFSFIATLAEGHALGGAVEASMSEGFDLAGEIAALLHHRIIIGTLT